MKKIAWIWVLVLGTACSSASFESAGVEAREDAGRDEPDAPDAHEAPEEEEEEEAGRDAGIEEDAGLDVGEADVLPEKTCGCESQEFVPPYTTCGPAGAPTCASVFQLSCVRCEDPCEATAPGLEAGGCTQVVGAGSVGAYSFWCCP